MIAFDHYIPHKSFAKQEAPSHVEAAAPTLDLQDTPQIPSMTLRRTSPKPKCHSMTGLLEVSTIRQGASLLGLL
jgi:hypothetical protein